MIHLSEKKIDNDKGGRENNIRITSSIIFEVSN